MEIRMKKTTDGLYIKATDVIQVMDECIDGLRAVSTKDPELGKAMSDCSIAIVNMLRETFAKLLEKHG